MRTVGDSMGAGVRAGADVRQRVRDRSPLVRNARAGACGREGAATGGIRNGVMSIPVSKFYAKIFLVRLPFSQRLERRHEMRVKVFILSLLLAFSAFGCSTNQTGKYVPTGANIGTGFLVINTQTGEMWSPRQGTWYQVVAAIPEPQIVPAGSLKRDNK